MQIIPDSSLFTWVAQQPHDRPVVQNEIFLSEKYTVGDVLMQFAAANGILCTRVAWYEFFDKDTLIAAFANEQHNILNFIIGTCRERCIDFGDVTRVAAQCLNGFRWIKKPE